MLEEVKDDRECCICTGLFSQVKSLGVFDAAISPTRAASHSGTENTRPVQYVESRSQFAALED
jgi:hypothetical protein